MPHGATRRAVLFSFAAAVARAAKSRTFPSEVLRYADALTEFDIERLTRPEHSAWLPEPHCRAASRRSSFVVYASDRAGSPQLFRLDHRSGASQCLTEAAALETRVFTLLPGDRSLLYLDGPSLRLLALDSLKERELYRIRDGWSFIAGLAAPQRPGSPVLITEERDQVSEVIAVWPERRKPQIVLHSAGLVSQPVLSPTASEFCCLRTNQLHAGRLDGSGSHFIATAPGRILQAFWRPDGGAVLYLLAREDGRTEIREAARAGDSDTLIAPASRFAAFAPNADGSVFAGAVNSAAQPHIVLLLRSPRKELTLCEHGASRPAEAAPAFSPDSQRLYFASDSPGKPCIFHVPLDRILERT